MYHAAQRPVKRLHCFHPAVELPPPRWSLFRPTVWRFATPADIPSAGSASCCRRRANRPRRKSRSPVTFLAAAHPSHGLPGVGTSCPAPLAARSALSRSHRLLRRSPRSTSTMRTVTQMTNATIMGAVGGAVWVAKARSEERPPSECMQEFRAKRPFRSHSLQFDRAATILTLVEHRQATGNAGRSVDQKGSARGYCGQVFGGNPMIRPIVACVVFDAVGIPTAGSLERKVASRDHCGRDHIMKRFRGVLCWIVLLTVIVPVGYRATGWLLRYDRRPKTDALASEVGRDLFLHEWTPGDPLAARGDGLGPVFNASSARLPPARGNRRERVAGT